ncbi:hypothetical protein LAZ40_06815 [Cereibacter sphaeroides]|uniref:hypothetical protein n=1 Tax=Cereibacter sphaeroides TaxID=1063 RepID=UPI001F462C74|nr:hypothetical protein [Cereibacter sphaeroides]MCE6958758.1 hypothetical protein [Cereibacter sphaeroides]MCE6973368.1 hypothetical protein [Cereibacter sphaeroides]
MEQARLLPGQKFIGDSLDWYTGPEFQDRREMMPVLFGRTTLPYGAATAYLIRRFGTPESGWDSYKELISWRLTTSSPDILLRITPYVGDDLAISMRVFLATDLKQRLDAWEGEMRHAWDLRWEAHVQSLPRRPWFDQAEAIAQRWGFRDRHLSRGLLFVADKKGDLPEEIARARDEAHAIKHAFEAADPFPGIRLRPARIRDFAADDPLKEIAAVLADAVRDLKRGVRVRDQAINLFGRVAEAELREHPASGLGAGALVNQDPDLFSQLEARFWTLGGGDRQEGMRRALELLPETRVTDREDADPAP